MYQVPHVGNIPKGRSSCRSFGYPSVLHYKDTDHSTHTHTILTGMCPPSSAARNDQPSLVLRAASQPAQPAGRPRGCHPSKANLEHGPNIRSTTYYLPRSNTHSSWWHTSVTVHATPLETASWLPLPWTLPSPTYFRYRHVYQINTSHVLIGFWPCPVIRVPDTVFMLLHSPPGSRLLFAKLARIALTRPARRQRSAETLLQLQVSQPSSHTRLAADYFHRHGLQPSSRQHPH